MFDDKESMKIQKNKSVLLQYNSPALVFLRWTYSHDSKNTAFLNYYRLKLEYLHEIVIVLIKTSGFALTG